MNQANWPRFVLCGVVTGGIWAFLSLAAVVSTGSDFLSVLSVRLLGGAQAGVGLAVYLAAAMDGLWVMLLYIGVSRRFGPGVRSALVSGATAWAILSLQSFKWITVAAIPISVAMGPLAASLPAMLIATLAGTWCYEKREPLFKARGWVAVQPGKTQI